MKLVRTIDLLEKLDMEIRWILAWATTSFNGLRIDSRYCSIRMDHSFFARALDRRPFKIKTHGYLLNERLAIAKSTRRKWKQEIE